MKYSNLIGSMSKLGFILENPVYGREGVLGGGVGESKSAKVD